MYPNPVKQAVPCGFALHMLMRRSHVVAQTPIGPFTTTVPSIYLNKAISISDVYMCAKMKRYQVCTYPSGKVASNDCDKNLRIVIGQISINTDVNKNHRSNASVVSINISALRQELFYANVVGVNYSSTKMIFSR